MVFLIALIVIGGYLYVIIHEIENEIESTKIAPATTEQELSTIESDTRVFKDTFDDYLLYSRNENRQSFLKE